MITAQEFKEQVFAKIDKFSMPEFPTRELEILANKAVLEFFDNQYARNDLSEKEMSSLRTWLVQDKPFEVQNNNFVGIDDSVFRIKLVTGDIRYTIKNRYVANKEVIEKKVPFQVTTNDLLGYSANNTYWRPSPTNRFYMRSFDSILLYCGKDTQIDKIYLSYYAKPKEITLSEEINDNILELDSYNAQLITDIVARKLVEVSGDPRYQTKLLEVQTTNTQTNVR